MDQIKEKTRAPYRKICETAAVPYSNWVRWKSRSQKAVDLVRPPGRSKVKPPDFGRIHEEIAKLSHGNKRTAGTGRLYGRYRKTLSRRELGQIVAMARREQKAEYGRNLKRIVWNVPNVAWSMDPCEYWPKDENKVYLNQMQDLASRYKFNPMTGEIPCGEEIAGFLTGTFNRFGAPLILKRDNGGNLNHHAVDEVLAEYFVLPLNSPAYYPPYNGAIEEAQTELKSGLDKNLAYRPDPGEHLEAYASTIENDLNHRLRPCLKGRNSCQVYFSGKKIFTKWERRDAYEWITNLKHDILRHEGIKPQTAWRLAVESWLNMKGLITITINGKVSPNYS